ncbi:MAG: GGDEF domain-containing protein [Salinarimonadaceae bacterium]|nr:MAG: GGDEF domain-containing protein [Salinarimonadaceae bacterium]
MALDPRRAAGRSVGSDGDQSARFGFGWGLRQRIVMHDAETPAFNRRVPCNSPAGFNGSLTVGSASFRDRSPSAERSTNPVGETMKRRPRERREGKANMSDDRGKRREAGAVDASAGSARMLDPRAVLTSIGEAIYDWNIETDEIAWSANAGDVLGVTPEALASGGAYGLLVEPGSGISRNETIAHARGVDSGAGAPFRTRYDLRLPDGRLIAVEDSGRWYAGPSGKPVLAHGVVRVEAADASAMRKGDRSAFIDYIAGDVLETARSQRRVTIMVAAIDNLERVNDEIGYDGGDLVIEEVARRIRHVLRTRDKVVRYATNRFAVAMMSCPPDQAPIAAARLREAVSSTPVSTAAGAFPVSLRIGAACAPEHARDAVSLMRRAEDALARAKDAPLAPLVMHDLKCEARLRAEPSMSGHEIIAALNERRLTFARQPVVCADSREVAFCEVLARLERADMPLLAGAQIVPCVERAGLMGLLDARMLELSTAWLAANPADRLSINVSPSTLDRPDWMVALNAHLGSNPGVAGRLIVEVTETAAVRDPGQTRIQLETMKAMGVSIAIDDFGAGHTSFRHLRSFPVDILKIDGAFVQNLARSPDDRFFVRTLVELAANLGVRTVAEWVEDEETARLLTEWGVDYLQGDHCGKPVLVPSNASAAALDGSRSAVA